MWRRGVVLLKMCWLATATPLNYDSEPAPAMARCHRRASGGCGLLRAQSSPCARTRGHALDRSVRMWGSAMHSQNETGCDDATLVFIRESRRLMQEIWPDKQVSMITNLKLDDPTVNTTTDMSRHVDGGSSKAAKVVTCDIAIAGGSTASLAAAITAAEAAPELRVCYTEITDWPGGQMTSGGVPAIDFGGPNQLRANQPDSFASAMSFIPGDGRRWNSATGEGSGSPGACSVSTKCYLPNRFVYGWIFPRLHKSRNLQIFLRTVVTKTERREDGSVAVLHVVQRLPRPGN